MITRYSKTSCQSAWPVVKYWPRQYYPDLLDILFWSTGHACICHWVARVGMGGQWFFPDGSYEWRRVTVIEETDTQLLVEWDHNGKQKWVTKMNILFEGDEEEVLSERRHTALERRCAPRRQRREIQDDQFAPSRQRADMFLVEGR